MPFFVPMGPRSAGTNERLCTPPWQANARAAALSLDSAALAPVPRAAAHPTAAGVAPATLPQAAPPPFLNPVLSLFVIDVDPPPIAAANPTKPP